MRQAMLLCLAVAIAVALFGCSGPTPTAVPVLPFPTLAPTLTPTPTRVLTELEAMDVEMRADFGTVHPNCGTDAPRPLQPGESANCTQYLWTKPITRTEWITLFPKAHFFLVGARRIQNYETNRNGYYQDNFVIAQQDGKHYRADGFQQLLGTNQIVVTDQNRELIARAFALMTLANYLEDEIAFSSGEEIDEQGGFSFERFNYKLMAWTKLQGLKIKYLFGFYKGLPVIVVWYVTEHNTGDYTEVPTGVLPWPNHSINFKWPE